MTKIIGISIEEVNRVKAIWNGKTKEQLKEYRKELSNSGIYSDYITILDEVIKSK